MRTFLNLLIVCLVSGVVASAANAASCRESLLLPKMGLGNLDQKTVSALAGTRVRITVKVAGKLVEAHEGMVVSASRSPAPYHDVIHIALMGENGALSSFDFNAGRVNEHHGMLEIDTLSESPLPAFERVTSGLTILDPEAEGADYVRDILRTDANLAKPVVLLYLTLDAKLETLAGIVEVPDETDDIYVKMETRSLPLRVRTAKGEVLVSATDVVRAAYVKR